MPKKTEPHLGHCPICGKDAVYQYRPFCSKKCADIDLGRWIKGVYATPSVDQTPDEEKTTTEE